MRDTLVPNAPGWWWWKVARKWIAIQVTDPEIYAGTTGRVWGGRVRDPDEIAAMEAEIVRLRNACIKTESDVQQILAKALGYAQYGPDGPGNAEAYVVGDHVAASLALEAANEIVRLRAALQDRLCYICEGDALDPVCENCGGDGTTLAAYDRAKKEAK